MKSTYCSTTNFRRILRRMHRRDKKMRKKYCHKGYHKLKTHRSSFKFGNERIINFEFLVCQHCEYKFFTTAKQKEKYIATKKRFEAAKDVLSAHYMHLSRE